MKDSQSCLPWLSVDWKLVPIFDPQNWHCGLKKLSKLVVLLKGLEGEQVAKDVIRFLTFSALDLTHTCCHQTGYFDPAQKYGPSWMVRCKDTSEIDEIRDEEKYLIEGLECLVERFLQDFEEQAVSLSEFLMEHWQKVMLEELLKKDEVSDSEKERVEGLGVRIVEADD
jgi:hypothetical protein